MREGFSRSHVKSLGKVDAFLDQQQEFRAISARDADAEEEIAALLERSTGMLYLDGE